MPLEAGEILGLQPLLTPLVWGFPRKSKLFCRQEGISPHCCSTTLIQAKSVDIKIDVVICLEQGGTDLQMHVNEWLQ